VIPEKLNPRIEYPSIKDVIVDHLDDGHYASQVSDNGAYSEPTNRSLITSTRSMSSTVPLSETSILVPSDNSPNFSSQDTWRSKYLPKSSLVNGHPAFNKSKATGQAAWKRISSFMPTRRATNATPNVQPTTIKETRIGYHITWRDNAYDIAPVSGPSAVFIEPQLTAARRILRFINDNPFMLPPDDLITEELAATSIFSGYCFIGTCRSNRRERPLLFSHNEPSENTLNSHIKYEHFTCTHFPCDCWYVLFISFHIS